MAEIDMPNQLSPLLEWLFPKAHILHAIGLPLWVSTLTVLSHMLDELGLRLK